MKRYVSLVPSVTHTIVELGAKESLVGCTSFCVEPSDLYKKCTLVGGTKDPNISKIKELKPDIVYVNSEENREEDILELNRFCQVVNTHPTKVLDVIDMIATISQAIDKVDEGQKNINEIKSLIQKLSAKKPKTPKSFLYLIWENPYMSVSSDTYISDFMSYMGLQNCYGDSQQKSRYPIVTIPEIIDLNPDYIFLSSEPFAFRNRHRDKLLEEIGGAIKSQILKIDGQLCSWHGTMTKTALEEAVAFREERKNRLVGV